MTYTRLTHPPLENAFQNEVTSSPRSFNWGSALKAIAQALTSVLTYDSNAPRISMIETGHGEPMWTVYDPLTQERATYATEQEVRAWLERRYSRVAS